MSATLGKRLREVRKRRGLTQRELASESGTSLSLDPGSIRPGGQVRAGSSRKRLTG
ncbi:hypothetical protein GCM10027059_20420 [Myceligenerans halotolerans]